MSLHVRVLGLLGLPLLCLGLILVAVTVYQEKVSEVKLHAQFPEEYHMRITTEKYVWNSRNLELTSIGLGLTVIGAICLYYSILQGLWRARTSSKAHP